MKAHFYDQIMELPKQFAHSAPDLSDGQQQREVIAKKIYTILHILQKQKNGVSKRRFFLL